MRVLRGHGIQLRGEIILPLVREHAAFERLEHVHTFGRLRGSRISVGKFEKPLGTRVFLAQEFFENFARPVEISAANERIAEGLEKDGVALRSRKWFEKRGR